MSLTEQLRAQIARHGPISVADFMAAALGDPDYGYYTTKDPFGLKGDFITSPEISQVFGELLGIWCVECWHQLGSPEMELVELGPGRGTLMKDLLRATGNVSGFHDAISVNMVEMSPVLRRAQEDNLRGKHPRIRWHETLPKTTRPMLLVANEFFDALPIRQFIKLEEGFAERLVGWDEAQHCFRFVPSPRLKNLPGDYPKIDAAHIETGAIIEQCPLAQRMMDEIATHIAHHGGAGIFIDYGYVQANATGDTLQAVLRHEYHDVLHNPGNADITAHVDFQTLAGIAHYANANVAMVQSQHDFLTKMGGKMRVQQLCQHATSPTQQETIIRGFERLIAKDEMGELFKVLAITSPSIHAGI